jgi:hypothetical protein
MNQEGFPMLINVRAEVVINPKRRYLTGPIRNPAALTALINHFHNSAKLTQITVHDDEGHALIADAALEHARRNNRVQLLTWGEGGKYSVEFARVPRRARVVPVVGGFPLLDARPPITEFDVHGASVATIPPRAPSQDVRAPRCGRAGGPDGQDAPAGPCASAPPRVGWLERLLAWFFGGVPQGKVLEA